ncbi:MAG TPA: XRE family transcriptional regulator [Lachnospiraceae bacterium]|nr:XRE family transcriptional regulator [Lachnospiraceae bacterium]
MSNIQLARNLRALRKNNNLSQADVGTMLNISRQAYSNYETSKRSPDLDILIRLAQIYHVTLDDLLLQNLGNRIADSKTPYQLALDIQTQESIYLTDEEIQMILKYRDLSSEDRIVIDTFLETHAGRKPAD